MLDKTKFAAHFVVAAVALGASVLITPATAQNTQQLNAYGQSQYGLCDAKKVASAWGLSGAHHGQIAIGNAILNNQQRNIDADIAGTGNSVPCSWNESGLTSNDARKLARFWGMSVVRAQVRAANSISQTGTKRFRAAMANALSGRQVPVSPQMTVRMVLGDYRHDPVANDWHIGSISQVGGSLRWTNRAGRSWALRPDFANRQLHTGSNNPYHNQGYHTFELVVNNGRIEGFKFANAFYRRATAAPQPPAQNPQPPARPVVNAPGFLSIVAKHSGKCLTINGGQTGDHVQVVQYQCNNWNSQKFQLHDVGRKGYKKIVAKHSGKCIDIPGNDKGNNVPVKQIQCRDSEKSQKFALQSAGNGYFHIISRRSRRCLDVPNGDQRDNIPVNQYQCDNSDAQKFRFVR